MANEIGSLLVRIGSDVTGLVGGFDKAGKASDSLTSKMRGGVNEAAKYGAAIAAAAATVAVALVKNTMDAIDAQAKLARQLRATSAGLETARHAANLAGLDSEQFTKAARTMEVRLGEVAEGTGAAYDAFSRLGLNLEELGQMDIDQRIATLNRAIADHIPAAERAAVASEFFGTKLGAAMQELNSGALGEARREVQALGLAVSEVDSATIERANDAITSIMEVLRGAANRFAVAVAPVIEHLAVAFRDTAIETEGWKNAIESAIQTALNGAAFVADAYHGIRVVVKVVANAIVAAFAWIRAASEATWHAIGDAMEHLPGAAGRMGRSLKEAMADSSEQASVAAQAWQEIKDQLDAPMPGDKVRQFFAEVTAAAKTAKREINDAPVDVIVAADGGKAAKAAADARKKALEEEIAQGETLNEMFQAEKERRAAEAEMKIAEAQRAVEAIRVSLLTEAELEAEAHETRLNQLIDARERGILTEAQYNEMQAGAAKAHSDRMTAIEQAGWTERQKFQSMSLRKQAKDVFGTLADITSGVAQHSRKLFEINKVAGIANAILNAYEGISLALSKYPPPLSFAMAAAQGVAAFAQVNAIRSTSFGSSGGAPSIAGSTPATPVSPVTSGAPGGGQGGGQTTIINLQGESVGKKQLRALFDQLNEERADGSRFVVA